MFMLPMRSIVLSKSKPWNIFMVEMRPRLLVPQHLRVVLAQVFTGSDEEAGGATGGVADDIGRVWRDHLHHEPDDVTRRAELTVLPGARDLAEHVLVDIALGVAVLHRDLGDEVDDLREELRA